MADEQNMTDYLIMLLSTDWFLPYWSEIGIDLDEERKVCIQQGCRETVIQILSRGNTYYESDFSRERKRATASRLTELMKTFRAEPETLETRAEWDALTHEKLKPSWFYRCMTIELVVSNPEIEGAPPLSPAILAEVARAWATFNLNKLQFSELCEESKSNWDVYTQALTEGLPEALGNTVSEVYWHHRFEQFWLRLRDQLMPTQLQELTAWYRASAKTKLSSDRPNLVPSYLA